MSDRWNAIVKENATIVLGIAWRILGNSADAEDVSQEVFLEAYRKWARRPDAEWTNLFRRLATCRALDRQRQRKPFNASEKLAQLPSRDPGPSEVAVIRDLTCVLRNALSQLPRREAEVFYLRYFDDLDHAEIAAVLHIKPRAVANALYKARIKLEQLLRRTLKGEKR